MHFKGFPHVAANFPVAIASTTVWKKNKMKRREKNPIAGGMNLFKSFCLELDKLRVDFIARQQHERVQLFSFHFSSAASSVAATV